MEQNHAHIVSYQVFINVLTTLLILLLISVISVWLDLGKWIIVIAMTISCVKAFLVMTWFMHLKYDLFLFRILTGMVAMLIVVIFVLMFFDYWFR